MGVEAIGSGIGSVASAVGRGVGKMAAFGAKLEAPLSTFVKEGPALSFTGFKPMGASDISMPDLGGVFKSGPQLNAVDAISEAQSILSQARAIPLEVRPEPAVKLDLPKIEAVREVINWQGAPVLEPATKTESASVTRVASQPQIESGVSFQTVQVSSASNLQEQEAAEVIEEKVAVEDPNMSLEEEVLEDERFYLEDEQASDQRKYEIREAIKKAKGEADWLGLKKITGWLVAKFLPAEHEGNRSQVVKKKGPDGSYQETVEAIYSIGELESEPQAEVRFNEIVDEKSPVKKGKHGRRVGNEEITRVFKYHTEPTIEDHPELAEVFRS